MRKSIRLALLLCVFMMGIALVPAHAQDDMIPSAMTMPETIAGGRPVTITIPDKPASSDAAGLQAWTDQVARFQALYPNVTINGLEYVYAPDTFAALVAGQQVPTLFRVYLTDPQKYIDLGVAADLSPIVDANNLRDVFNPDTLSQGIKDDKVYGLTNGAYAMGIGYNIPLLQAAGIEAPPTTWDELVTDAKLLTNRDNGVSGFSFINDGSGAAGWHFTVIAYTFGATPADLIASADGKYTAGFGSGAAVDAMNFIKGLRWTDDVLPHDTIDWPTNGTLLATGQAAMVMMAGDQYGWIKTQFPDLDMSTLGFAPLPAGPGGSVSLTGGDMLMVSSAASADEQEAATYFALWRLLDPTENKLSLEAQKAGGNPVIGGPKLPLYVGDYEAAREAFEKPYATLPYDNYSSFLSAISSGKVKLQVEPTPAGQEYYSLIGTVITSVLNDESVDPATALADAASTFQATTLDTMK